VDPVAFDFGRSAGRYDLVKAWPGVADVNRAGLVLAVEMLELLEDGSGSSDKHGI
jgi:hypothetical protein